MTTPAQIKAGTAVAIAVLLLAAGAPFVAAQASVPQQLNGVRQQLNQTEQPAPAQTQTKTPSPAPQSTVKPQANSQAKPSTPAKPSTQSGPVAQGKPPVAAASAGTVPPKPQAAKPGAAVAVNAAQAKPGAAPLVKIVKPTNELQPRPSAAANVKNVAAPAVQPKATPAVAEVPVPPVAERPAARRDPFDPLVDKTKDSSGGPQAPLPAGKPGLVVATLRIDGVVKGNGGMIAIVSNPQMRVYFLREGDRLYDGDVAHISMEGVAFHENGKDAFGKSVEREVTKRLYPTPGEQQ